MDKTDKSIQNYLDSMPMGMCRLKRDETLSVIYANSKFYSAFLCNSGCSMKDMLAPEEFQILKSHLISENKDEFNFNLIVKDKKKVERQCFFYGKNTGDQYEYWDGVVFGKTAVKKTEKYFEFLFANKNKISDFDTFKMKVFQLIQKRDGQNYSLWYSDLKNFNLINDIYGYDDGDKVLEYWIDVIQKDMAEGETFIRLSADYMVVLRKYENQSDLKERFQKISGLLSDFSEIIGKKIRIELVSGIYCIENDKDVLRIEDMIDRANIAKKSIKSKPGSNFAIYTEKMKSKILKEKEMEAKMHNALENGEFEVYLQPQVDIQAGDIVVGAEALVRWESPTEGLLPPSEFIPIFEQNGFISKLDAFVFQEICSYQLSRIRDGKRPIKISVNVSRFSAFQDGFTDHYIKMKQRYKIPNGLLELECTETTIVDNVKILEELMTTMRLNGFSFSLDDFGSGYSSLNLLKDVTVDVLKLDMMFFSHGISEVRDHSILESVIAMAKKLNMEIVAEGVETKEHLELLRGLGCDIVQGYYFGKPSPIKEFEKKFRLDEAEEYETKKEEEV